MKIIFVENVRGVDQKYATKYCYMYFKTPSYFVLKSASLSWIKGRIHCIERDRERERETDRLGLMS